MDTLKTKTAKSNHGVFNFHLLLHMQQGTVYSLIKCVFEYTVVEWPQTFDE